MKRPTAALLTCGIVAGAMLPTVLWIDGATRPGYSLWHHGASQLGLGERASLQTGNFVLAGILVVLDRRLPCQCDVARSASQRHRGALPRRDRDPRGQGERA